ncbi:MAG: glycerol-3-phosphate 1-O-acyltransferase PlsY [Oscillospiraceae bacterium]|nr:glycerol-3-phosphate 1-O-acyltransferase PlsY [Oscillospiraceae bacterium]
MAKLIIAGVISAIISYLLGSCNSSIIVVRLLKHEDVREHGSKNAGLTNTLRCYGKIPALFTLVGDLAKGVISVLLSILVFHIMIGEGSFDRQTVGYISGIFAILGHIFPIYYGFRGGKGVLVACSILLVIDWQTFVIIIPFFAVVLLISKYVSVASISSAVFYPVLTFLLHYFLQHEPLNNCIVHTALVAVTSALLIYMHRTNIQRLKNGTENKFIKKKTPTEPKEDNNG